MKTTSVQFTTGNATLQQLYDLAEQTEKNNLVWFGNRQVLVEGGGYQNIWLETQPMGGEMYAKRNAEVALNNQLLFMENQREDGRIPGMIRYKDGKLIPSYGWFQGFCFPYHALNLYYMLGLDRAYLEKLYQCLERFDAYLWATHDSDGDGCLEVWCQTDTGEDHCARYPDQPWAWDEPTPPVGFGRLPYESMDCMGYCHDGRRTLAEVADLLGNGHGNFWRQKATEIRQKMRSYLWREEKGAFYDRDCDNQFMDVLFQGNIKALYFGCFEPDMADRFLKEHLFNPKEFWTPVPLPSIALNDPLFSNAAVNNWSGQPQALTYQRSIRAMENYGRYQELIEIGTRFLRVIEKNGRFTQQFDPFTGESSLAFGNGDYGPCILSVLEFISRMYGAVQLRQEIHFGAHDGGADSVYMQKIGDDEWQMQIQNGQATGLHNGAPLFTVSLNTRVITDLRGHALRVIYTGTEPSLVRFCKQTRTMVKNESWVVAETALS